MKRIIFITMALLLFNLSCTTRQGKNGSQEASCKVRLITLDPGHFHAALVQKISYPQVCKDVYVYAPQGDDLKEHLKRIDGYNTRAESPTAWNEIIYTGADYLEKMLKEKKGNVMVTAGNNGKKTAYIKATLSQGINVLADKPMAITVADFNMLKECFEIAKQKGVLLYDIMTERFEITTILQKEFSLIPGVYGVQQKGTPDDPGIVKESVHHFLKTVSGNPLIRPVWFFDVGQQGEGIVDVTTHLVDLVQWECFPGQIIDTKEVQLIDANRWATTMTLAEFQKVTGHEAFPDFLKKDIRDNVLHVFSNGDITYRIKDVIAKVSVIWNYTFPEGGGDTHYSIMKGSKSHLIIEQGKEQGYKPQLTIKAVKGTDLIAFEKELTQALKTVSSKYPGVTITKHSEGLWKVEAPAIYHNGHEAHFGQVTENFLKYLSEGALPAWEVPNMITKYSITTGALEMAKNKTRP